MKICAANYKTIKECVMAEMSTKPVIRIIMTVMTQKNSVYGKTVICA